MKPVYLLSLLLLAAALPLRAEPPPAGADNRTLQRNLLELLRRVDQMEQEIRQLRGDIEVMNHNVEGVKRRQRELYLDVDRRLRELELGARPAATPPAPAAAQPGKPAVARPTAPVTPRPVKPGPPPVAAAPSKPAAAAAPTPKERIAYRTAFNLLKEGRYAQSISAFEKFLKQYPDSSYADNAQYWLGEANYVSRKYKAAVREFKRVLEQYPDSPKRSDAMLKLGFTYYELKQWKDARRMLEQVLREFPKSTPARLAQTRLNRMKKEGH